MMRIEFILVLATRVEVHRRGYWHKTIADGIREVKEETGIEVSARELIPLGVMSYEVVNEHSLIEKLRILLYIHSIGQCTTFLYK
ncbi:hypothetical protein D3C77_377920 [compost metagenome]